MYGMNVIVLWDQIERLSKEFPPIEAVGWNTLCSKVQILIGGFAAEASISGAHRIEEAADWKAEFPYYEFPPGPICVS
jgi:hypothetical protein